MSRSKLCGSICLIVLISGIGFSNAVDDVPQPNVEIPVDPKWDFKTKTALEAKRVYDAGVKEAQLAFVKAMNIAEKQLVLDLKQAMKDATQSAALDDAIKIRSAVEFLEKRGATTLESVKGNSAGVRYPFGKWQMITSSGPYAPTSILGTYDFRSDGTVFWKEKARQAFGKVTIRDGVILVVYPDDRTERITPSGPRLLIEHWCPSSNYPSKFPMFVYAERIK